jgi:hypothetical protein
MVMIKIPGVTRPCSNLQIANAGRLVAVAVSSVLHASTNMEAKIMRLRLTLSANRASMAAEKATPSVDALMVRLTLASEAWNTLESSGRSGCVQYKSINANMPQKKGANSWLYGLRRSPEGVTVAALSKTGPTPIEMTERCFHAASRYIRGIIE